MKVRILISEMGDFAMGLKIHIVLQCAATFLQVVIPSIPGITPEWKDFGHAIVGGIQGALGVLAHFRNPDGTSAVVAYERGMKIEPPKGE